MEPSKGCFPRQLLSFHCMPKASGGDAEGERRGAPASAPVDAQVLDSVVPKEANDPAVTGKDVEGQVAMRSEDSYVLPAESPQTAPPKERPEQAEGEEEVAAERDAPSAFGHPRAAPSKARAGLHKQEPVLWLLIYCISGASSVCAVLALDEERFNPGHLFLVIVFQAKVDLLMAALTKCIKPRALGFVAELFYHHLSKALQFYLYSYFASWDLDTMQILAALAVAQGVLLLVSFGLQLWSLKSGPGDAELGEAAALFMAACVLLFCLVLSQLEGLVFFLFQEEAPYRQKWFQVFFFVNCFLWDLWLPLHVRFAGVLEEGKAPGSYSCFHGMAALQYVIWLCVVTACAWLYWLSGDIEETLDKVITLLQIIASCLMLCGCLKPCCCGGGTKAAALS